MELKIGECYGDKVHKDVLRVVGFEDGLVLVDLVYDPNNLWEGEKSATLFPEELSDDEIYEHLPSYNSPLFKALNNE